MQALYSRNETKRPDMCAQRRLWSDCAYAQSDQSLHWPHAETVHPGLAKNSPGEDSDCANAHADLNVRWAHMSEGTFFGRCGSNVRAMYCCCEIFRFFLLCVWILAQEIRLRHAKFCIISDTLPISPFLLYEPMKWWEGVSGFWIYMYQNLRSNLRTAFCLLNQPLKRW